METIINKFIKWKEGKDEDYIYDEIFEFVDGELSRGEMVNVLNYIVANEALKKA